MMRATVAFCLLAGLAALLGGDATARFAWQTAAAGPASFQCHWDSACPDITVTGDPLATLGGNQSPFRGYGDPSLERDPATGTIWMTYSWLQLLPSDPGPPPVADFGVETHLARSDDGGQTFTFVRALNTMQQIQHPDTSVFGWATHEVSTIAARPDGWEAMWLTYFDPLGPPGYSDFYYTRSLAATPDQLGDVADPWIDGYGTSSSWDAQYDLSAIPELSDCAVFTEPALFTHDGATYLATNCVVIVDSVRRSDLERLVLLQENANGSYTYVGNLLDHQDAQDNGGDRIEQADLALAQNGAVLLIATPISDTSSPTHHGCKVFEVSGLGAAQVRRDGTGAAVVLAGLDGDDPTLGAGLCTYDPASATGVVIVLHDYTPDPFDILFSMRATGVHPEGLDSDADGRADTADNCSSWPNATQSLPAWTIPAGDSDCDGFTDTSEAFSGADPAAHCPTTSTANDEPAPDAWPVDFNDDQKANVLDVAQYSSRFNSAAPGPPYAVRYDLNGDSRINVLDVSKFSAVFGKSCAP